MASAPVSAAPRRRWRRVLGIVAAGAAGLGLTAVCAGVGFGAWLTTDKGDRWLERTVQDAMSGALTEGSFEATDIEFARDGELTVVGVRLQAGDGTEVLAAARSHNQRILAASDNFGRVRLLRYPCVSADATDKTFRAHGSEVRKVRWTSGDTHLLSIGGKDRCVFQWRLRREDEETAAAAGDSGEDSDLDVLNMEEEEGEEVEFMTVKPWLSVIVAPTGAPKGNPSKPGSRLLLDWVHGYRAQDVRGNLRYNMSGSLVYVPAGVDARCGGGGCGGELTNGLVSL